MDRSKEKDAEGDVSIEGVPNEQMLALQRKEALETLEEEVGCLANAFDPEQVRKKIEELYPDRPDMHVEVSYDAWISRTMLSATRELKTNMKSCIWQSSDSTISTLGRRSGRSQCCPPLRSNPLKKYLLTTRTKSLKSM